MREALDVSVTRDIYDLIAVVSTSLAALLTAFALIQTVRSNGLTRKQLLLNRQAVVDQHAPTANVDRVYVQHTSSTTAVEWEVQLTSESTPRLIRIDPAPVGAVLTIKPEPIDRLITPGKTYSVKIELNRTSPKLGRARFGFSLLEDRLEVIDRYHFDYVDHDDKNINTRTKEQPMRTYKDGTTRGS